MEIRKKKLLYMAYIYLHKVLRQKNSGYLARSLIRKFEAEDCLQTRSWLIKRNCRRELMASDNIEWNDQMLMLLDNRAIKQVASE